MNEFKLATLATGKVDLGATRSAPTGADLPEPTELKFTLDTSGQVERLVKETEGRYDSLITAHDLLARAAFPYTEILNVLTGLHLKVQDVARCMGAACKATRLSQDVRPPRGHVRECPDAQVPARAH